MQISKQRGRRQIGSVNMPCVWKERAKQFPLEWKQQKLSFIKAPPGRRKLLSAEESIGCGMQEETEVLPEGGGRRDGRWGSSSCWEWCIRAEKQQRISGNALKSLVMVSSSKHTTHKPAFNRIKLEQNFEGMETFNLADGF